MRLVVYRHEGMKSSGAVYIHSYQFVARAAVRYARYCLFFIFILHWVRAHLLFTYFLPSARPHPLASTATPSVQATRRAFVCIV